MDKYGKREYNRDWQRKEARKRQEMLLAVAARAWPQSRKLGHRNERVADIVNSEMRKIDAKHIEITGNWVTRHLLDIVPSPESH